MDILSILGGSSPNGDALIPHRDPGAIIGSVFIQENMNLSGAPREANILHEFLAGNVPDFLRKFVPVTISDGTNSISYLVMPDVLALGSDDDYVRMPMAGMTAKQIADTYDCTLPTKKMCDQIWANAQIKLEPHPKGAPYDTSMLASSTYAWHNSIINSQLQGQDHTKFITGHKKDVIIDKNWLSNMDRVVIYGWFQTNGVPIQGPTPNWHSHELKYYADYSHGIRMIAQDVIVNGNPMRFFDVLNNPNLASLISDEGAYDASIIYK